jgi:flavorubredoxin
MQPAIRALVLYDTLYGSTEKIARALTRGFQLNMGQVDCQNIKDADAARLTDYNLIAVGAPTQAFSASRPMKDFLHKLEGRNLAGRYGFAFDTKIDSRFSGSAAKYIESRLRELGLEMLQPRKSAIVTGGTKTSTLDPGEEESFEKLGYAMSTVIEKKAGNNGSAMKSQTVDEQPPGNVPIG